MDDFQTLNEEELLLGMKAKLFGQMNLLLLGQHWINKGPEMPKTVNAN
jgi:hypothetical protein